MTDSKTIIAAGVRDPRRCASCVTILRKADVVLPSVAIVCTHLASWIGESGINDIVYFYNRSIPD